VRPCSVVSTGPTTDFVPARVRLTLRRAIRPSRGSDDPAISCSNRPGPGAPWGEIAAYDHATSHAVILRDVT